MRGCARGLSGHVRGVWSMSGMSGVLVRDVLPVSLPCPSRVPPVSRRCPAGVRRCPAMSLPCPAMSRPCPAMSRPCPAMSRPCPAMSRLRVVSVFRKRGLPKTYLSSSSGCNVSNMFRFYCWGLIPRHEFCVYYKCFEPKIVATTLPRQRA